MSPPRPCLFSIFRFGARGSRFGSSCCGAVGRREPPGRGSRFGAAPLSGRSYDAVSMTPGGALRTGPVRGAESCGRRYGRERRRPGDGRCAGRTYRTVPCRNGMGIRKECRGFPSLRSVRRQRPVEPNPPAPRWVSESSSTCCHATCRYSATTIWAMRSPGSTVKGWSLRLARMTFTSPR